MTDIEIIDKILNSKSSSDVFSKDWKKEYIRYSNLIHPDKCSHPSASKAMAMLNTYKVEFTKGVSHVDDSGPLKRFDDKIIYGSGGYIVFISPNRVQELIPADHIVLVFKKIL